MSLKLHLGCGSDIKPGWVNIDLDLKNNGTVVHGTDQTTQSINHDLSKGLPIKDLFGQILTGNISHVYSSHFWEHLTPPEGMKLLRECYEKMERGGYFRISLPKTKEAFKAYLEEDYKYFEMLQGWVDSKKDYYEVPAFINFVDVSMHQFGEHKHIIDQDKAIKMLQYVGFTQVAEEEFDPDFDLDNPLRRHFSFYVRGYRL